MVKCSFCGSEIARGTGKMYVKKDGTVYWFDQMKCEKNLLKLGRTPAKLKWTETHAKLKTRQ